MDWRAIPLAASKCRQRYPKSISWTPGVTPSRKLTIVVSVIPKPNATKLSYVEIRVSTLERVIGPFEGPDGPCRCCGLREGDHLLTKFLALRVWMDGDHVHVKIWQFMATSVGEERIANGNTVGAGDDKFTARSRCYKELPGWQKVSILHAPYDCHE